jgi:hypothetical protein
MWASEENMKEATSGRDPIADFPFYENLNAEAPATKADIMRLEAKLDRILRQMGLL